MGLFKKLAGGARKALQTAIPRPGGDLGGDPARGEVVEVLQAPWGDVDDMALWRAVTVAVRRTDAPDSGPTTVTVYLHGDAWRAISAGDDVPIRVDGATGAVLGVDGEVYEQEVERRREEDKARPAPDVMAVAPDALAPIEGVTLEQWAAVEAGIARDRVAPADYDRYAESHGVPPGRWGAIRAAWQQRTTSDWRVGARFGEAYQAALQNG